MPHSRLQTLLMRALHAQTARCQVPHTADDHRDLSLLVEHRCERQGAGVRVTRSSPFPRSVAGSLALHEDEVWSLAFSPDRRTLLSAGRDGTIAVIQNRQLKFRCQAQPHGVTALAWNADSRTFCSGGEDGTLRVWSMEVRGAPNR